MDIYFFYTALDKENIFVVEKIGISWTKQRFGKNWEKLTAETLSNHIKNSFFVERCGTPKQRTEREPDFKKEWNKSDILNLSRKNIKQTSYKKLHDCNFVTTNL